MLKKEAALTVDQSMGDDFKKLMAAGIMFYKV